MLYTVQVIDELKCKSKFTVFPFLVIVLMDHISAQGFLLKMNKADFFHSLVLYRITSVSYQQFTQYMFLKSFFYNVPVRYRHMAFMK
jgi:hypothetical protein